MLYYTGLVKWRPRKHVADEVLDVSFNHKRNRGSQTGRKRDPFGFLRRADGKLGPTCRGAYTVISRGFIRSLLNLFEDTLKVSSAVSLWDWVEQCQCCREGKSRVPMMKDGLATRKAKGPDRECSSGSTSKVLSTYSPSTAHYEYDGILLFLDFDVHTLADQFSCFSCFSYEP